LLWTAFSFLGRAEKGSALVVAGYNTWNDYTFRVAVKPLDEAAAGVTFCFINDSNYHLFRWEGGRKGRRQLIEVRDGERKVLSQASGDFLPGIWYEVGLELQGNLASVLPSYTEGLPAIMLEAMACGLKVVTSNEAFQNILPGEFLAPKDAHAIAEKIVALEDMDVGDRLRRYVVENHNLRDLIKTIVKYYTQEI